MKERILLSACNTQGCSMTQSSLPEGMLVVQFDHIYLADGGDDRVMRWCEDAREETMVVGGN